MRIEIATLFPDMCETVLSESIIGRARRAGKLDIHCRNIRDYTLDKHRRVDDTPYGGGKGMLMQAEPIYRCYEAVCEDFGARPHVIFMSPQGKPFTEKRAIELSQMEHILILCGHYEGVDQRVIDEIVDEEISIGDYVLTGGELGALVVVDASRASVRGRLGRRELLHGREPLQRPAGISPLHPSAGMAWAGGAGGAPEWQPCQDRPVAPGKVTGKHLAKASGSAPDSAADR